jgi:hypothetical protein
MSDPTISGADARTSKTMRAALIGLIALATLAGCAQHRTPQPLNLPPDPSGVPSTEPLQPPVPLDATYHADVENVVASRLHTSVAAIDQQLRAQSNSTLLIVAKPAGLAQDQLAASIISALEIATSDAQQTGRLSVAQAAQLTHYWNSQSTPNLITETSYWYLHDHVSPEHAQVTG